VQRTIVGNGEDAYIASNVFVTAQSAVMAIATRLVE